ncbi:hypothetical protein [Cribrihabitans marinus]|nr:hypothetical protein [Cribrihabitans marinus]GGH19883.1 hypothetical protein GCM10010973_03460 [Cribrihabitans marinus]
MDPGDRNDNRTTRGPWRLRAGWWILAALVFGIAIWALLIGLGASLL